MIKKMTLPSLTVVAALALAIPAFASAAEFKDGGVPVEHGHLHLHGKLTLTLTASGLSVACTVTATVTIESSTSGTTEFSFSECDTNFGCAVSSATSQQSTSMEPDQPGGIIIGQIKFVFVFSPSPPCPAALVVEGSINPFVDAPITDAVFSATSGDLETNFGPAGVSGTLTATEGSGTYEVS